MAKSDYFLKLDGIEGESIDDKHSKEIEIGSFSWGVSQLGYGATGGGSGAGKASVQDLHITKDVEKSSPNLAKYCANGKHIATATLTLRKAGEDAQEYVVFTLSQVLVSSYQISGSGHGGIVPQEQVSLNFQKIQYDYLPQKGTGSLGGKVTMSYDAATHKTT